MTDHAISSTVIYAVFVFSHGVKWVLTLQLVKLPVVPGIAYTSANILRQLQVHISSLQILAPTRN